MLLREGDTWRLLGAAGDYVLMRGAEARARGVQCEAPFAVGAEIARCLDEPVSCDALRAMLEEFGVVWPGREDPHRGSGVRGELGWRLARALEEGRVVARREVRPVFARSEARDAEEPLDRASASVPEEETWIAIELVDEATPPRPVAHARYRITLPGGDIREGRLDAMGLARVDGIESGVCEVTFPDIDGREWRAALGENVDRSPPLRGLTALRGGLSSGVGGEDALGTDGPPPPGIEDDWIRVMLFDSAGAPVLDEGFEVRLSNGEVHAGRLGGDGDSAGVGHIAVMPFGQRSTCAVTLAGDAARTGPLPAEAPPAGEPEIRAALVAGPLFGPTRVTRRDLTNGQAATLNATNVFQLRRQKVHVVEVEHFTAEGAVALPGLAPSGLRPGALAVTGIESLRVALLRAEEDDCSTVVVTGHGGKAPNARAKSVLHLLRREREAWVGVAAALGSGCSSI